MKIVADESVDFCIIEKLRQDNIEVVSIIEKCSGISDKEVLLIAEKEQCILLTEDKDFGELSFRLRLTHYGILLIRLGDLPRNERIELVSITLKTYFDQLRNNFSVLTKKDLRIKSLLLK